MFFVFFLVVPALFLAEARAPYNGQIVEDSERGYSYFVPYAQTAMRSKLPVLVSLPGKGLKSKNDLKLWSKAANENGFFVMGMDIDYSAIKKENDLRRIQFRITDGLKQVSSVYNLRTEKIYLAGSSAGGATALALSLRYPDEYQAVGVIGGGSMQFNSSLYLINAEKKQFFIIHGDHDSSIPIGIAYETQKELEQGGGNVKFLKIPNGEHALPVFSYEALVQWFAFQENLFQGAQSAPGAA